MIRVLLWGQLFLFSTLVCFAGTVSCCKWHVCFISIIWHPQFNEPWIINEFGACHIHDKFISFQRGFNCVETFLNCLKHLQFIMGIQLTTISCIISMNPGGAVFSWNAWSIMHGCVFFSFALESILLYCQGKRYCRYSWRRLIYFGCFLLYQYIYIYIYIYISLDMYFACKMSGWITDILACWPLLGAR